MCFYFLPFFLFSYCVLRAVGNKLYGSRYHDQLVDAFRKEAEHCDCLQSFFLLHSMGGGKVWHGTVVRGGGGGGSY